MIGSTVDDGVAFVDKLLACLAGTREGLVSDDKVERKVLAGLGVIRDPRMREELQIFQNLFPGD